jgi:hypothetical protein
MIDAFACEPHFLDHLAPVWRSLPDRGTFYADTGLGLVERARERGVEAQPIDALKLRTSSRPPLAKVEPGPLALVASIGDTKIARRLGYRRFVYLEHGAAQSYSGKGRHAVEASYSGGPDREDVVLFLVPNEQAADRWRASYPQTPVEVVGCPKLDDLPKREPGPGPVVAISFHWPTPTWALAPEAGNALGTFMPALRPLRERFAVIGHSHPRYAHDMARIFRKAGIEFVPEFDDVCRRADVYVCDNSSTIFEFAATGRPVVLMNAKTYRKDVSHGGRFWDWAHVGIQVDDHADLISSVELALADPVPQRAAREDALGLVYAHRSGGATRAVGAIRALLGEKVAA